ncbi:transcription antitermination factor NusB [Ekhidna sp.]|uniref:transcription antitermination factor NusB n=1 Tax=Ekhidna sp. TaxID=2608089 RepID=UPI003BADB7B1
MLNRRILRVKAMQALYGYFTAVESMKEVKRNELEEMHALDPAKHDFSDKALFEARKKQAVKLFNENLLKGKVEDAKEAEEEVVRNVNDALSEYESLIHKEARVRKNDMMKEAERLQDTYIKLLLLPIEIEQREKLDSEKEDKAFIAKEKKPYAFIGNKLVQDLKASELLQKEAARSGVSWDNEHQDIKSWYRDQIRTSEALQHFFGGVRKEDTTDNDIVLELFKRVVFKNEAIASYLESNHLHWVENQPIIKSMVVKTIKGLQDGEGLELAELTKNGEDDFKFLERLFMDVVNQNEFLEEIIQSKTMNWDVDRIALTDRVILKLALVEMMNSPSIPIKVTINEAIEISKIYSTPKSKQFVNGVLDVLSNELTSSGKIRKSGRGLIDNK